MMSLLSMLGMGLIGEVRSGLVDGYKSYLNAKTEKEKSEAHQRLQQLEAQKAVLVAEARSQWNMIFRTFMALPFALFVWKVVVWDKLLGLGITDDLGPNMWKLLGVVYGFYFLYEITLAVKK